MVAAYRDGQDTARARARRDNPWDGRADDTATRILSVLWARGYSAGHPVRLSE